ncbi:hypothetical protein AB0U42_22310, partial [Escherichia coli]
LNRLIRCVCGKKIGPDPRNFNQRVCLGRNDLLIRTFLKFAGRQRQHHQDNVLPHPILHKSEFDFSSKVVKSERRRVRLLRIINNASVGRELRAHYSSGLEE